MKRIGLSAKASNHYLAAIRQFLRWAGERGYSTEDPLRVLRPLNARVDRRHLRRALSEAELRALVAAAHAGATIGLVPGPVRALVYALAAETGLRANELASKHRREDFVPLRPSTARAARAHAGRGALESAFALPAAWRPPVALRADLKTAGIDYADESGRRFDFHALRGMTATRLLAHGASPKVAQSILRHATADLTMSVHAKRAGLGDRHRRRGERGVSCGVSRGLARAFASARGPSHLRARARKPREHRWMARNGGR